uniref:Uncharacterized protein n=1 Tax=Oryza sativa subsp. japonica TaxID=39947 RepID=Q7EY61_ORYSJ|nr:unknown protein [Oryza sativa Japonica Group]BAD31230.1 unknown protein [Oryza sativa Japonica Group]
MPKEHNECTSHLSLSHSPTPLFLISRAKAPEATAHPPHRVPSPRKHTPRTECPKLGHLPRLRRLSRRRCASPDQSVEHVVGVTVLAAGHPNRRRRSGRRSSPPKQHQANVRALSRPGDVDAGFLPPWANNHRLRRSLDLAASVSLLEEEYVEEEEGEFLDDQVQEFADEGNNDCLDEEFDVTCDVADFQDGSN